MRQSITLALTTVTLLALAACSGATPTPPAPPSPTTPPAGGSAAATPTEDQAAARAQALLSQAVARAGASQVYRFTNEVYVANDLVERSSGEFVAPDRLRVLRENPQGGRIETVTADGAQYVRRGDGPWAQGPGVSSEEPLSPLLRLMEQFVVDVVDVRAVGEETMDGVAVLHVRASTDMAKKALRIWPEDPPLPPAISEEQRQSLLEMVQREFRLNREQYQQGTETVELWIGVEDGLVRQARIATSIPAYQELDPLERLLVIQFNDYGADLDVHAPAME